MDTAKIKRMSIKEFRKKGYLQELNRRFLHPLGMALEVIIDEETKEEKLGGVWDFQDDPEGIYFSEEVTNDPSFKINSQVIAKELRISRENREKLLGFFLQPTSKGKQE